MSVGPAWSGLARMLWNGGAGVAELDPPPAPAPSAIRRNPRRGGENQGGCDCLGGGAGRTWLGPRPIARVSLPRGPREGKLSARPELSDNPMEVRVPRTDPALGAELTFGFGGGEYYGPNLTVRFSLSLAGGKGPPWVSQLTFDGKLTGGLNIPGLM